MALLYFVCNLQAFLGVPKVSKYSKCKNTHIIQTRYIYYSIFSIYMLTHTPVAKRFLCRTPEPEQQVTGRVVPSNMVMSIISSLSSSRTLPLSSPFLPFNSTTNAETLRKQNIKTATETADINKHIVMGHYYTDRSRRGTAASDTVKIKRCRQVNLAEILCPKHLISVWIFFFF